MNYDCRRDSKNRGEIHDSYSGMTVSELLFDAAYNEC